MLKMPDFVGEASIACSSRVVNIRDD